MVIVMAIWMWRYRALFFTHITFVQYTLLQRYTSYEAIKCSQTGVASQCFKCLTFVKSPKTKPCSSPVNVTKGISSWSRGSCEQTHTSSVSPFNSEITIVIFIHCKQRIAVAIRDWQWMKMNRCGWWKKKQILLLLKQFHEYFRSKTPRFL